MYVCMYTYYVYGYNASNSDWLAKFDQWPCLPLCI